MPRPGRKTFMLSLSTRQSLSFRIKEIFILRSPFGSSMSLSIQELWRVMPTKEIYIIERKKLGLALHFHKLADPHTLEPSQLPFFVFLLSLHSYRSPKMFSFIFVPLNTPKFRFTKHTNIDLSNCASSNSSMMIRIDWILISMSFLSTSIALREELDYASMKFQQRTEIEIPNGDENANENEYQKAAIGNRCRGATWEKIICFVNWLELSAVGL